MIGKEQQVTRTNATATTISPAVASTYNYTKAAVVYYNATQEQWMIATSTAITATATITTTNNDSSSTSSHLLLHHLALYPLPRSKKIIRTPLFSTMKLVVGVLT